MRRAYLALARRHHPDYHGDDDARTRAESARRMQEINQAWTILRDPDRRRAWESGERGATVGSDGRPGNGRARRGWQPLADDDAWMDDFAGGAADEGLADDVAVRRPLTMVPMALVAAAVGSFSLGLVMSVAALLALAVVLLVGAGGFFVLLPVVEMLRSRDDE